MPHGMSIEEFMRHSGRGGGKKKYLKGWRDKQPFAITVWLHTQAPILAILRHGFPKIETREDAGTRVATREVWNDRLVCYEDETTLANHWRERLPKDRPAWIEGEREAPIQLCPLCFFVEATIRLVREAKLNWLTPLFAFEGTDATKNKILHAGGLYNAFGSKRLTPADTALMKALSPSLGGPLFASKAWMENIQPKLEYVFTVVDDANPQDGIQLAVESNLLGDKVKTLIAHAVKERNGDRPELGLPTVRPYAIRWEYDASEGISFDKKYDAIRMGATALRPAIEKLIRETAPPDLETAFGKFNVETLRARIERHYIGPKGLYDLDAIFAPVRAYLKSAPAKQAESEDDYAEPADEGTRVPAQIPSVSTAPPEPQMVACDKCDQAMDIALPMCPHCGFVYVVEAAAPPPARLPTRAELMARKTEAVTNAAIARSTTGSAERIGRTAAAEAGPLAQAARQLGIPESSLDTSTSTGFPGDPSDDIPF